MENTNDKNLTAQGFDESNEYSAPKMSKDVTEQDFASKSSSESEPDDEGLIDETSEVIPEKRVDDDNDIFDENENDSGDEEKDMADETDDTLKPKKSEDAVDVMNRGEQKHRNIQEEEPK